MARRKGVLGVWQAWRGEFYATVSFSPQDFSVEERQDSGTRRSRELETWLNEVAPKSTVVPLARQSLPLPECDMYVFCTGRVSCGKGYACQRVSVILSNLETGVAWE